MKFLSSERLSEHKFKTPEGYLICTDAILARTGKQTYRRNEVFADSQDESEIEIDRRPEEVFSPATLASFENKPITVEHPNEDVNAGNYNELAVGFVRDVHKGFANGQEVMLGTLVITDATTIEEIENGEHTDLSCGYDCDIADEANPQQRNIRGNHVALCQQGRAGIARIVDSVKCRDTIWFAVSNYDSGKYKSKEALMKDLPNFGDDIEVKVYSLAKEKDVQQLTSEDLKFIWKNGKIIKDSVKDAQEYKINYYNSYTGRYDVDYITANNVKEAIKKFGDNVALRGDGTANINVNSVSPNDGYMRLYGKLSELLKSKDLNDSTGVEDSKVKDIFLNGTQINTLRKYADRYGYEIEDVYDALNYKISKRGKTTQVAIEELLDNMVGGYSLKDSIKDSPRSFYTQRKGIIYVFIDYNLVGKFPSKKEAIEAGYDLDNSIMFNANYEVKDSSLNDFSILGDSYTNFEVGSSIRVKDPNQWQGIKKAKVLKDLNELVEIDLEGKVYKTHKSNILEKIEDKLIESGSEEAFKKNIATEIRSGKDPKQAAAIAYSIQRENDSAEDKNYTYVMFGSTGKFETKNLTLKEADNLLKNNVKLGYEGEIIDQTNGRKIASSKLNRYDSIEDIPLKARQEMENSSDKEATLLGILNELQQEVDKATNKQEIKEKAEKILNDLKIKFNLKNKNYIKLDSLKQYEISYVKDGINHIDIVKAENLREAILKMNK